jgi:hypothetical protein
MSTPYAGDPLSYPTNVRLVDDGEPASAAFLGLCSQDLADRTAWLKANLALGATPPAKQDANADATIADDVGYVLIGARAASIALTLPAAAPIGRKLVIVETAGQGDFGAHSVGVVAPGGQAILSTAGAAGPVIFYPYDRIILEKINATTWIASVQPACTAGAIAGTYNDFHYDSARTTLPIVLGITAAGTPVADGDELTDVVQYGAPSGATLVVDYRGAQPQYPVNEAGRTGILLDTSWLAAMVVGPQYGALIKSVTLRFAGPGGHPALPQYMPKFGLYRYAANTGARVSTNSVAALVTDTSANVAAYETEHDLTFTCDQNNRVLSGYRWWLEFFGEGGTNSAGGSMLVSLTYSMGAH